MCDGKAALTEALSAFVLAGFPRGGKRAWHPHRAAMRAASHASALGMR